MEMDFYFFPDEKEIFLNFIKELPETGKIIEWGCGGSTIKILENLSDTQSVLSIEHDKEWHDKVYNELLSTGRNNWQLIYANELPIYQHRIGTPDDENPVGYDNYIFPNESVLDGNIYLIDGVARSSIALMLLAKAKNRDAVVLIHDANHRQIFYNWAANLFPKTERVGTGFLRLYLS